MAMDDGVKILICLTFYLTSNGKQLTVSLS